MCSVKSDANTQMPPKEQPNSSSTDEGSWSGSPTTDELTILKKGPWTAAEDATLREFVNKYGQGNWNSVQKNSGLLRCGKSCRLRWANHLRPELKKMAFTQEEERFIIETHAKIGNKWAQMASLLPGRTDNEIKNYWNTRTKRRQRAGLPLYSHSNNSPRALNVNHPIQNASQFCSADRERSDNGVQQGCLLHEIPEFQFDTFKTTTAPLSYAPPFSGINFTRGMLCQDLGPYTYSLLSVTHKRAREEEPFNELDTHSDSIYRNLGLDYPCHHELGYPYDPDPSRHAVSNGINSSYSHLPGAVKMELPSLQYPETNYSNWLTTDSIHVLSPQNVSFLSECASPRNSGLLEALVHESRAISAGKKPSSEKSSCSSAITDPVESAAVNFCTAEWEEISNNRSAISLNGSDETMPCVERLKDSSNWLDFSRPDVLFDSDWFLRSSQRVEEISATNDGFDAHIGQNPSEGREGNIAPADVHVPNGTSFKVSPGSCPWNSMPSVRQMLEHH